MNDLKLFKIPHEIKLLGTPNYGTDYHGGERSYDDFKYTYDFWSEPALNQGHTGTCVYHSHIGAAGKLVHDSLTGFAIANTIAYLDAWKNHHSSKFFATKLIEDKILVPYPKYNSYPSFITEYCYKYLEKVKNEKLSHEALEVYNNHKIKLESLHISYKDCPTNVNIVPILKDIIDKGGVAMVSIDYPSGDDKKTKKINKKCLGNIWLKHKITSGNYWYCNRADEKELTDWFKDPKRDGWHSVIFFGYAESDGKGAFAYKNSWGSANGENGNYYMSFNFLDILAKNRGSVSLTSMTPKKQIPYYKRAFNDYIQYVRDPKGQSVIVKGDVHWYYNFGSHSSVAIGTGLWATNSHLGIPNDTKTYTISEYSGRSTIKDGNVTPSGELLSQTTVELSINDKFITIKTNSDKIKAHVRKTLS